MTEVIVVDRDWHSYDDNIMRDRYDDMELASDFSDSISNITYPDSPSKKKDPNYLAGLELFRERLKSKYHYKNLYVECNYEPKNMFP